MTTPDMIPDEVWHTAMSTYHKTIKKRPGSAWQEAIAAALNAWPGMQIVEERADAWAVYLGIAPLPMENTNAES